VDITPDKGQPVLAFCRGAATEDELSEWVNQLRIPLIYEGGDNGFMLIHCALAGGVRAQSLPGSANKVEAAAAARRLLAAHPGHAVLNNDQGRVDYRHESEKLMNVVIVIYGAALTVALTKRPRLLLHPAIAPNRIPSLALVAAGLLTVSAFYGYVLFVGGKKGYDINRDGVSTPPAIIRFAVDLVLAILYVHLLFAAVQIGVGTKKPPDLDGLMLAFILVFLGAVVVWASRGLGMHWVAIGGAVIATAICLWTTWRIPTRDFDFVIEGIVLAALIVYTILNHLISARKYKQKYN
jgi:hypothetical protein